MEEESCGGKPIQVIERIGSFLESKAYYGSNLDLLEERARLINFLVILHHYGFKKMFGKILFSFKLNDEEKSNKITFVNYIYKSIIKIITNEIDLLDKMEQMDIKTLLDTNLMCKDKKIISAKKEELLEK